MINEINNLFPEFINSKSYHKDDEDLPYIYVGDFGIFAKEELDKGNKVLVNKIIKFINSTYQESDNQEKNLIWIGFFEVVASNPKWHSLLLNNLIEPVRTQYYKRFEKNKINGIFD